MTTSITPSESLSALEQRIAMIGDQFAIAGDFISGEEIQSGHINTTYRACYLNPDGNEERYILQRINERVFKDPRAVMRNVEKVTRHINWKCLRIRKDSAGAGQTLNLYPARGGRNYIALPDGGLWRCYNNIEGTHTYDVVENTRQAYQAAFAFGSFQDLISDMNPADIVETIPHFHHTRKRYNRLVQIINADPEKRACRCESEIAYIKSKETCVDRLLDMQASGELPTRITHNDTKINNVMLDSDTDQAVCVIDLDTVMPGLILYDFGDMIRSATCPAAEDEEDLSKVFMQISLFESLAEGYLDAAGSFLTEAEIAQLAFSGELITLEIAIRFLSDYLEGDVYFKTHKPDHNLIRTRNQLKLAQSIGEQLPVMEKFIQRLAKRIKR